MTAKKQNQKIKNAKESGKKLCEEFENDETLEKFRQFAPESKQFWVCNGSNISHIEGLSDAFESMDDPTYDYHANGEKNDFSNWVRDVHGDEKLAEKIKNANNRKDAQIRVLKYMLNKE